MDNRSKIQQLLQKNILIDPALKQDILEKLDTFSEAQILALIALAEQGNTLETQAIEQAATQNPDLLSQIKHIVYEDFSEKQAEKEAQSDREDNQEIQKIEKKLENL
jgi:hypothetical protein